MTKRYLVLLAVLPLGGCYGLYGHDEVDRYFQRSDTITMSAGDAKEVNAVTHTIHPWPRYVGNRRLAYDARRTSAAVNRYTTTTRPVDQLPNIGLGGDAMGQPPPSNQNINISGTGAGAPAVAVPVGGATAR
ncbi:hypothetical protein QA640_30930 [Bradyrhizobium sp. CB82]|uniref:hypothetical protein n=1 Tax=Bradyrhizobium sp. CB82 TaxID=3039159 RepID=UPI0024B13D1E|nr:hypothetical protein [Bradyrhizobium sp. CB82]WFU38797.1 hypothetical protein QA640_30930 [Bradyrhizobium sp. CB82]